MDAGQINYITLLNELSQKCSWTVEYQEVNKHGPEHTKIFTISAVVTTCSGEKTYADGSGRNKREAKQFAAKNAYDRLKKEELLNSVTTSSSPDKVESFAKLNHPNYTCWLNEYAQKNKLDFKAMETTKKSPDMNVQFCIYACQYVCDEKEFAQALGKGKKEAKETAAKLVYEELVKKHETEALNEHSKGEQSSNMSHLGSALRHPKLSSHEHSTADQNFIGILNQYCQTNKLVPDFKLIEKSGPAHKPEFVYKVVINKRAFPEGRGKTVKEAKQNAAQAWYEKNRESSDQSSRPEYYSLSQTSDIEPDDDLSTANSISENQNTSESVIFRDTSADKPDIISPVSQQCSLNVRAKRKLAANFQFSPNRSKEEAPYMNVQHVTKPSTKENAVNQSTKSRFLEEFNSIQRIGKGGFGRVFKAKGNLERLYYAVKIVKYTDKACREVEGLAKLNHTNIVRYHTSWIEDTAYNDEGSDSSSTSNSGSGTALKFLYIQMEFCEGETLGAWIERNSQPKQNANRRQEAAQIMKQVLGAVKYVHSKSLIHRDLKPANIMIERERRVKVVDFGLVTTADADNDGRPLERTKKTGTRSYMSPEQINHSNYDRKVDIFALGLIYFELLWNFGTCAEKQKVWENVRHKNLPKTFDEKFEFEYKLILQMLSINPEERPDAIKLFSQLDQYIIDDHNAQRESRTY